MTDEQRLQMITEQLIIVRDNLFRGMSKSIQKLQARSINEVLELENFTQSPPQRTWIGLTQTQVKLLWEGVREEAIKSGDSLNWVFYTHINEALKNKNTREKE